MDKKDIKLVIGITKDLLNIYDKNYYKFEDDQLLLIEKLNLCIAQKEESLEKIKDKVDKTVHFLLLLIFSEGKKMRTGTNVYEFKMYITGILQSFQCFQ